MAGLTMAWRSKLGTVALIVTLAGCGGGGSFSPGADSGSSSSGGGGGGGSTDGVNVCTMAPDADILVAMDSADDLPDSKTTGPSGPFIGCSWGTGWLLVQIAEADGIILPPTRLDGCEAIDLGEVAEACPGQVSFFVDGIHTSVSTIDRHPKELLIAVAELFLPYVQDL